MNDRHPLIVELEQIYTRRDRTALAALRRSFLPGREASVYPYVARFFPQKADVHQERTLATVARLFGMHPGIGGIPLSKALQSVAASTGSITIDQRFVALLDADSEGLFEHLRHAILLVRAHQIRVDWNDLLIAMFGWNREDRVIQRLWARAYWGNEEGEEDAQP